MQIHSLRLIGTALVIISLSSGCRAAERAAVAQGTIAPAPSMHDARADHTATLLRDGRVLITGGMVENGVFLRSAELFDPKSGRFEELPPMKERRVGHTASLLPDGRVVVAGGSSGREFVDGEWKMIPALAIEVFDPVKKTFNSVGELRTGRTSHSAITMSDGRVLLLGGDGRAGVLESVEVFDPRTGRTEDGGRLASARDGCGCVALKDGRILLSGGSSDTRVVNGTYEIYNPATKNARVVGTMKIARRKHAAVLLEDGRVLIVGGSNNHDWTGQFASAEIFDPHSGSATSVANMANERFKIRFSAVLLKNGHVLVTGGKAPAEVFDPQHNTFAPVQGTLDGPRYFSTATLLGDGRVLIAGGYGNGSAARGPLSTNGAWMYIPAN